MRLLTSLLLITTACSSDDGTPPEISALTYSPSTITRGQQSTVSGTVQFTDSDGDLSQMKIEVVLPDQTTQAIAPADLQNTDGMTTGTIGFAVAFVPPQTGTYTFSLWLTDDADNESNRLDGTLTAQ